MTRRSDGRYLVQLTMQEDLYQQVQSRCRELDVPITVYARELIRRDLAQPSILPHHNA
jgi:hypothetical protein